MSDQQQPANSENQANGVEQDQQNTQAKVQQALDDNNFVRVQLNQNTGQSTLLNALSFGLWYNQNQGDRIQKELTDYMTKLSESQKIPPKLIYMNDTQILAEYLENPGKKEYEFINLELTSLLYQRKIIIHMIDQNSYLNAIIINNKFENTLSLFKMGQGIDVLFHKDFVKNQSIESIVQQFEQKVSLSHNEVRASEDSFQSGKLSINSRDEKVENYQEQPRSKQNTNGKHQKSLSETNLESKVFNLFQPQEPSNQDDLYKMFTSKDQVKEGGNWLNNGQKAEIDHSAHQKKNSEINIPNFSSQQMFKIKEEDNQSNSQGTFNLSNQICQSSEDLERPELQLNHAFSSNYHENNKQQINQQNYLQQMKLQQQQKKMNSNSYTSQPQFYSASNLNEQNKIQLPNQLDNFGQISNNNNLNPNMGFPNQHQSQGNLDHLGMDSPPFMNMTDQSVQRTFQLNNKSNNNNNRNMGSSQGLFNGNEMPLNFSHDPAMMRTQMQNGQWRGSLQQQPVTMNMMGQMNSGSQQLLPDQPTQRFTGKLKFFDETKNYGFFIMDCDNSDIFVHLDDFEKAQIPRDILKQGRNTTIRFEFSSLNYVGKHNRSRKAVDLKLLANESDLKMVMNPEFVPNQAIQQPQFQQPNLMGQNQLNGGMQQINQNFQFQQNQIQKQSTEFQD